MQRLRTFTRVILTTSGILTAIVLLTVGLGHPKMASAHTIHPAVEEYIVGFGQTMDDKVVFTNTGQSEVKLTVSAGSYDHKKQTIDTEGKVFVTPKLFEVTVPVGQSADIPFTIDIPKDITAGSYFNMLVMEEEIKSAINAPSVGIKAAYGVVIVMHVAADRDALMREFVNNTSVALRVVQKGFPYIQPLKVEYTFTNNSNYVFVPSGEIRIFRDNKSQPIIFTFNSEGTKVFPGEQMKKTVISRSWNWPFILPDKKIISRTYCQYKDKYYENNVTISLQLLYVEIISGVLVVLFLLFLLIRSIFSHRTRSKQKALRSINKMK